MIKKILSLFIFILAFVFMANPTYAQSDPAFTLTAPQNTFPQGIQIPVTLTVSTNEKINAVQATITYPASKITFVKIDTNESAFPIIAKGENQNGTITIAQGTTTPVSGTNKVATIIFQAKSPTDFSEIILTSPSLIASSTTNSNIFKGTTFHAATGNQVKVETKAQVPAEYLTPAPTTIASQNQAPSQNVIATNSKGNFLTQIINFFKSLFKTSK